MSSHRRRGGTERRASSVGGKTPANGKPPKRPRASSATSAAAASNKKQQHGQRRATGNVKAGNYKGWFVEDMDGALTELYNFRIKHQRVMRGTQDDKPPSLQHLCDKYSGPMWEDDEETIKNESHIPKSTLSDYWRTLQADTTGELRPSEVGALGGSPGRAAIVPLRVMDAIAGWMSYCDGAEVRMQVTTEERGSAVLMAMDEAGAEYPVSWTLNDGPDDSWWKRFLRQYDHLSLGKPNGICEARTSASTVPAINGWFDKVELGIDSDGKPLDDWHGVNPEGYAKFLKKNWGHEGGFLSRKLNCSVEEIENGNMDATILVLATDMVYNPKRHVCEDQKGFASGGSGKGRVYSTKGGHRYSKVTPDGQWITITLATAADGTVLFTSLTVKGSCRITGDQAAEALFGDTQTQLSTSKSGYSNGTLHVQMWEKFLEHQKETHPDIFPLTLWQDNWSGQVTAAFKKLCLDNGIIVMMFRSHSTHWACWLDKFTFWCAGPSAAVVSAASTSIANSGCVRRIFESEYNRRHTIAMREWQGRGKNAKLKMSILLKCIGASMKVSAATNLCCTVLHVLYCASLS